MLPTTAPADIDKYFFNRKKDIEKVERYIYTIKDDIPSQIFIGGVKGVGKTFFVKKLLHDAGSDILTIYIDLSNIYAHHHEITEEAILKELLTKINDEMTDDTRLGRIKGAVNSFVQNFFYREYIDENIDIFNITLPKFSQNYSKLSKLVFEMLQKIVDSSSEITGIIIAFDESDLLKKINNPEAFIYLFRSSMKNQRNIAYVFSGNIDSEMLDIITSQDFNFASRIPRYYLNPFSCAHTRKYLQKYAQDLKFTSYGFEMLYRCTGGVISSVINFANSLNENIVYDEEKIVDEFFKLDLTRKMWAGIWNKLSVDEKSVIKALMDDNLTFDELALKTSLEEVSLQKAITSLNHRHIAFNGEIYYIKNTMLRLWMNYEKRINGFYPI